MPDNGVSIPKWGGRRALEALHQVKATGKRNNTPCCLCGQPIDYSLPSTDPDGCSLQHIKARKFFPELMWVPSNWAPAHLVCNQSAGTGVKPTQVGVTSTDW